MNIAKLLLAAIALITHSVSAQQKAYLKGELTLSPDYAARVYLVKLTQIDDFYNASPKLVIDSAEVFRDGKFAFRKIPVPALGGMFRVQVKPRDLLTGYIETGTPAENFRFVWLAPDNDLSLKADCKSFARSFQWLKSTPANDSIQLLWERMGARRQFQDQVAQKVMDAGGTLPDSVQAKLLMEYISVIQSDRRWIDPLYLECQSLPAKMMMLIYRGFPEDLELDNQAEYYDFAIRELERFKGTHPFTASARNILDQYDFILPIGSKARDFELLDENGKPISLSSLKGRYVVLDFWASYCNPCIANARQYLMPLYKKYAGKVVEILGVSLDPQKENWLKSLKKEQYPWPNVWAGAAGSEQYKLGEYQISDLPRMIVLDPEGNIVAKNLSGPLLEIFLNQVIGK